MLPKITLSKFVLCTAVKVKLRLNHLEPENMENLLSIVALWIYEALPRIIVHFLFISSIRSNDEQYISNLFLTEYLIWLCCVQPSMWNYDWTSLSRRIWKIFWALWPCDFVKRFQESCSLKLRNIKFSKVSKVTIKQNMR